jgi:GWxTD domain-containing protein
VHTQHRNAHRVIGFILFFLTAIPAFAGLSAALEDWGSGPAQWIMTSEEKKAWRKISTDADAINFMDLFWARRDPTPGTAVNEFRDRFMNRVAFSDMTFIEKRKRGAMTDRGRVYIVLGAATNMTGVTPQVDSQPSVGSVDPGGGQRTSRGGSLVSRTLERDVWIWNQVDARKFEMGEIEVVFVEDPVTRSMRRDPYRTDFGLAGPVAIRKAIVSPDLTAVPAWATTGGLNPVIQLSTPTVVPFAASTVPQPGATTETPAPIATPVPAPATSVNSSEKPGISRLTLLKRGSINPRSTTDPFAIPSQTAFKTGSDILWAVQFCDASQEWPALKFTVAISGPLDGASTNRATGKQDAKSQPMSARPGCHVVQGKLAAPHLPPGRYELSLMIDDTTTNKSHRVKTEFRVE